MLGFFIMSQPPQKEKPRDPQIEPLLMGYHLETWQTSFEEELESYSAANRAKAGGLLPLIPDRERWDEFSSVVKSEWNVWKHDLDRYPACLIVLYGGLAFFEYGENTFWPYFGTLVGSASIPQKQKTALNDSFFRASERYGLRVFGKSDGRTPHYYVSLAVSQIGIPLSLWDGFLEICEWASWLDNWDVLSDEDWAQAVTKRAGSRNRLKRFLTDNRDTSTSLIKELLDARSILTAHPQWTVTELSRACFLRAEYFEEVPETAEFLRPTNPESLIRDRAQLILDEQKARIVLYLPGIQQNKLPATWCLGHLNQSASRSPDELILNSLAFQANLNLNLVSGNKTECQRLRGLHPWGLFSSDRLVNTDREYLPLLNYVLVSHTQLTNIAREGFEETDCPVNQTYELADDTQCYVTHLWPTGKFAELTLGDAGQRTAIRFRTRSKIEARFFPGRGHRAANFDQIEPDRLKIEHLPVLCLAIPHGYFRDTQATLKEKFRVQCDGKPAGGKWERVPAQADTDDKEFFSWNWGPRPFIEQVQSGTLKSLRELSKFFRSPDLKGPRTFTIESPEFTVSYPVYLDHPKPGMDDCLKNLPGAFLPWFLLCQTEEGMKWDDLLLARDIIAPSLPLSAHLLRKYEKEGFFVQKGVRWKIAESRATVCDAENNNTRLDYCGDPSVLWRLYRWMFRPGISLPNIEVVNKRGEVPYLRMNWGPHFHDGIIHRLQRMNVRIGASLWNH
jgi:hypothetical protein